MHGLRGNSKRKEPYKYRTIRRQEEYRKKKKKERNGRKQKKETTKKKKQKKEENRKKKQHRNQHRDTKDRSTVNCQVSGPASAESDNANWSVAIQTAWGYKRWKRGNKSCVHDSHGC